MNHAPAVQYPVGRSVWATRLQMGGWSLWGMVLGVWWYVAAPNRPPGAWWFALAAWSAAMAWWYWRQQTPLVGVLHWEPPPPRRKGVSGAWRWFSLAYRNGVSLESVVCVWDVQSSMLIRCKTSAGLTLWLWLHADADPAVWPALRRATHAPKP